MKNKTSKPDKKATTQWEKAAISYRNYQEYIAQKKDKFNLTLIDLFYISNFKGGNATINEPANKIQNKLSEYSKKLTEIDELYGEMTLSKLSIAQLDSLIEKVKSVCLLATKGKETKIDGFSASYISALLNAYFPSLIPILDRRVLINIGLANANDVNSQGQIIDIVKFYEPLIRKVAERSASRDEAIRDIDRELFITTIPDDFKKK